MLVVVAEFALKDFRAYPPTLPMPPRGILPASLEAYSPGRVQDKRDRNRTEGDDAGENDDTDDNDQCDHHRVLAGAFPVVLAHDLPPIR